MKKSIYTEASQKGELCFCVSATSETDARLWSSVFGDSDGDVKAALAAFGASGCCVSLKVSNVTASQFIGIECTLSGARGIYIYALCTHPEARGRGYMRTLIELAKKHFASCGYKFFLLLPASEALSQTYVRMGFSISVPAYATFSPEGERDFFGVASNELLRYGCEDFQGDMTVIYETSSRVFSFEVFEYCLSSLSDMVKIKRFEDADGMDGFLVSCGDRVFLSSRAHSHLVKNTGSCNALIMPFENFACDASSVNVEPMPR